MNTYYIDVEYIDLDAEHQIVNALPIEAECFTMAIALSEQKLLSYYDVKFIKSFSITIKLINE